MRSLVIIFLVLFSTTSLSADWRPLDGIYAVTAHGYLDPATDEANDSHYRLQLRGGSAKDLYQAMKVAPMADECTGELTKNIGQMQCLYDKRADSYECHFSIEISTQTIDYGVAC